MQQYLQRKKIKPYLAVVFCLLLLISTVFWGCSSQTADISTNSDTPTSAAMNEKENLPPLEPEFFGGGEGSEAFR